MVDGFDVDVGVLADAASGISQTMGDMRQCEVEYIVGPEEMYGHAGVHGAFEHFCDRWQEGVELLLEDGGIISDALIRAVDTYVGVDTSIADGFRVQSSGPDPGVAEVNG